MTNKSINSGTIWTLTIGLALFIWGLVSLLNDIYWQRNIAGTPWLMLPGAIMLISGISQIITYRHNRQKVLNALKAYQRVSIAQLADELGMKERDVKRTIVDLRTEGRLRASFDPKSGGVIVLDVQGVAPLTINHNEKGEKFSKTEHVKLEGYCQYCGSMVKSEDVFCNNCGSSLK